MRGAVAFLVAASSVGCAGILGVYQLDASDTDASSDLGTLSRDAPGAQEGTTPPPHDASVPDDDADGASDAPNDGSGSGSGSKGGGPKVGSGTGNASSADDADITDADFGLCPPFSLTGCKPGLGCQPDYTEAGDFSDYSCWYVDDAGPGASCTSNGECANGLTCIYTSDTALNCFYPCFIPGGGAPFDAAGLAMGPGTGGCPSGDTCQGSSYEPAWLGICFPPGAD